MHHWTNSHNTEQTTSIIHDNYSVRYLSYWAALVWKHDILNITTITLGLTSHMQHQWKKYMYSFAKNVTGMLCSRRSKGYYAMVPGKVCRYLSRVSIPVHVCQFHPCFHWLCSSAIYLTVLMNPALVLPSLCRLSGLGIPVAKQGNQHITDTVW